MKKDTKTDLKPQIDASINVFFALQTMFFCKCLLICVEETFSPAQEIKDRKMVMVTLFGLTPP